MLPITKMLTKYNHSPRTQKITHIVTHDVGAVSKAKDNATFFNTGDRGSSADFFVDSTNIFQIIDYHKNYSWAVGDGHSMFGIGNGNSVSIEMCLEANHQPSAQTIKNTQDLIRFLMKELNIPLSNCVRHFDVSRKNCPTSLNLDGKWTKWIAFKKGIVLPVVKPVVKVVKPIVKPVVVENLYRVRLSWLDAKGQIGAYSDLNLAKADVDTHAGYKAYNTSGVQVYPIVKVASVVTPVAKLAPVKPLVKPVVKEVVKTSGVVIADKLNVRESAIPTSKIIGELTKNTTVKIAKKVGNVYEIYFGNHGGFISAQFIK